MREFAHEGAFSRAKPRMKNGRAASRQKTPGESAFRSRTCLRTAYSLCVHVGARGAAVEKIHRAHSRPPQSRLEVHPQIRLHADQVECLPVLGPEPPSEPAADFVAPYPVGFDRGRGR